MRLKEGTFIFKAAITVDRFFNFCTGGSFQECFSTRAYKRSETAKPIYRRKQWVKIKQVIDAAFWEGHCRDSFVWEMKIKQTYIDDNKELLCKSK